MATGVKFYNLGRDVANGVHDFNTHVLKIAFSLTEPDETVDEVFADLVEISAGFGYSAGGVTIPFDSDGSVAGLYKAVFEDVIVTASGGDIGPFRYLSLYNSTPVSPFPVKPLIAKWDRGFNQTIFDGEPFTIDVNSVAAYLLSLL